MEKGRGIAKMLEIRQDKIDYTDYAREGEYERRRLLREYFDERNSVDIKGLALEGTGSGKKARETISSHMIRAGESTAATLTMVAVGAVEGVAYGASGGGMVGIAISGLLQSNVIEGGIIGGTVGMAVGAVVGGIYPVVATIVEIARERIKSAKKR